MSETYRDRLILVPAPSGWPFTMTNQFYTAAEQEKNAEMVWGLAPDLRTLDWGDAGPQCHDSCRPVIEDGTWWHLLDLDPNDFHPVEDSRAVTFKDGDTVAVTMVNGAKVSGVIKSREWGAIISLDNEGAGLQIASRERLLDRVVSVDSVISPPPPDPDWWGWDAITLTSTDGQVHNWWRRAGEPVWFHIGKGTKATTDDVTRWASEGHKITQLHLPQSQFIVF